MKKLFIVILTLVINAISVNAINLTQVGYVVKETEIFTDASKKIYVTTLKRNSEVRLLKEINGKYYQIETVEDKRQGLIEKALVADNKLPEEKTKNIRIIKEMKIYRDKDLKEEFYYTAKVGDEFTITEEIQGEFGIVYRTCEDLYIFAGFDEVKKGD